MTVYYRPGNLGTVVKSVSDFDDSQCVDIFRHEDGRFGFELYRRDVESGEGWFPIGFYSGTIFETQQDAWHAALAAVAWLKPEN